MKKFILELEIICKDNEFLEFLEDLSQSHVINSRDNEEGKMLSARLRNFKNCNMKTIQGT